MHGFDAGKGIRSAPEHARLFFLTNPSTKSSDNVRLSPPQFHL